MRHVAAVSVLGLESHVRTGKEVSTSSKLAPQGHGEPHSGRHAPPLPRRAGPVLGEDQKRQRHPTNILQVRWQKVARMLVVNVCLWVL